MYTPYILKENKLCSLMLKIADANTVNRLECLKIIIQILLVCRVGYRLNFYDFDAEPVLLKRF